MNSLSDDRETKFKHEPKYKFWPSIKLQINSVGTMSLMRPHPCQKLKVKGHGPTHVGAVSCHVLSEYPTPE